MQRFAGEQFVAVAVVWRRIGKFDGGRRYGEQLPTAGQFDHAIAIGQEAVMPDPLEPVWHDMQQEAANELMRIQAHHFLARFVTIILPMKAYLAINEIDQAVIGNGHPMRVATEVLEYLLGAAKRWLGVNVPLNMPYGSQILGKGTGSPERFKGAKKVQVPGVKSILQLCQKQPPKQP